MREGNDACQNANRVIFFLPLGTSSRKTQEAERVQERAHDHGGGYGLVDFAPSTLIRFSGFRSWDTEGGWSVILEVTTKQGGGITTERVFVCVKGAHLLVRSNDAEGTRS